MSCLLSQLHAADHHDVLPGTGRQKIQPAHLEGEEMMSVPYERYSGLRHIDPVQLDYIVRQVQAEGYHVEHISSFGVGDIDTEALMITIKDWAASANLKAGFNHAHDLCVFEQC
jgi:hypothetical protein